MTFFVVGLLLCVVALVLQELEFRGKMKRPRRSNKTRRSLKRLIRARRK